MSAFNSTLTKALNVFITKVWSKLPPSGLNNYLLAKVVSTKIEPKGVKGQ